MNDENLYHSDLRVDVHLDAYLSLTRLADRRWRIGVMLQPRQADAEGWWVNDAQVALMCASGPLVSAVTVARVLCLWVPCRSSSSSTTACATTPPCS